MDEQQKIIQSFFKKMSTVNKIPIENINKENTICSYRWQLSTDKENSIWELKQIPSYIVLTAMSLKFENFPGEKVIFLLNRLNFHNRRGTFFLDTSGGVCLENSHFYRKNVYIEEEIALFITKMVDHLSFLYLVGDNYLNNNLEIEKAVQTSIQLMKEKKN